MTDPKINISNGSKEQVALDLAKFILSRSDKNYNERDILILYRKCYKATLGFDLTQILEEEKLPV
ncbi:MAG: hypothetical protein IPH62_00720 [Ignavibacteriae bacterium]|nr:hypothetical protein [Ignavibacteriota bacterium]